MLGLRFKPTRPTLRYNPGVNNTTEVSLLHNVTTLPVNWSKYFVIILQKTT